MNCVHRGNAIDFGITNEHDDFDDGKSCGNEKNNRHHTIIGTSSHRFTRQAIITVNIGLFALTPI